MKPAPFRFMAPHSLDEALAGLASYGYEAKLLAGGQSLIPTMNFRLAQPGVLIDLNRIPDLSYIHETAAGGLRIGAMTRQRAVERSALVGTHAPLLHAAMPLIAHVQIRNRGTIGGSLAHADPAAELPAVVTALGGTLRATSADGVRSIGIDDFWVGLFATELVAEEVLTEIELPPLPPRFGWSIQELARRQGDYAMVGAVATLALDGSGVCKQARLVYFSVGEGPVRAPEAERMLIGERITPHVIAAAAQHAATVELDPPGDIHASAAYRRRLAKVLGERTLAEAAGRAALAAEEGA